MEAQGQTTWAFKLRPGVKFHNGDPLTSADVKYSLERTWDPALKTRVNTVFTTIDKVEAPDPITRRHSHQEAGPAAAGAPGLLRRPDPAREVRQVGRAPTAFNLKPIGSGPVRFVSWTKDDRAVLEANPDYWGGKLDFDRMIFRPFPRRRRAWPRCSRARST